jgi:hypothetical protein
MRVPLTSATFAIYYNGTQNAVRVTATGASVTGLTGAALGGTTGGTGATAPYVFFTSTTLTANTGYDFDITLSAEL